MEIKLSWNDFEQKYKPQLNHIDPNANFNGWGYETFGKELEYVQSIVETAPNRVWTILDCDGAAIIGDGYHHVNRMAYVITEIPFADEDSISAVDRDDEERFLLGVTVKNRAGEIIYQQLNGGGIEGVHSEFVENNWINEDETDVHEFPEWLTKNGFSYQFTEQ
jgi:hypothetical protein